MFILIISIILIISYFILIFKKDVKILMHILENHNFCFV